MKNKIYFGLFLGLMVVGGIAVFATGQRTFSEKENRYLKTFSDITSTDEVEKVLTDQFALRDEWLALHAGVMYARGMREINDTFIGSDGYLMNSVAEWEFDWNAYVKNLQSVQAFYEKNQVNMDVVLVPSNATILADHLPSGANVYNADQAFTIAKDTMNSVTMGADASEGMRLRFIDLRETMTDCEKTGQAYYRTDHHWTTLGARAAYAKLHELTTGETLESLPELKSVTEAFYGTMYSRVPNPLTSADTILALEDAPTTGSAVVDAASGDVLYDPAKLETKDKYAYFLGGNQARADYEGSGTGRLLLIKDSYANSLVPFLLADYAHITVLDLRFFNSSNEELMEEGFDHVMVLYEMSNFAEDTNVYKLAR